MFDTTTILHNADLKALAESAGAEFKGARSKCPLHGGENATAFEVYRLGGEDRWHCHTVCGDGNAIDFVMTWRGLNFVDACKFLGGEEIPADPQVIAQHAADKAARAVAEMQEQLEKYQAVLSELRSTQRWLEYHAHLDDNHAEARGLWTKRGVPEYWQEYWQLGYNPLFGIYTKQGQWHTPTLTIPIYGDRHEVMSIRHRLLNPPSPTDKYRPERSGLKALPFICDLEKGYDFERVLVVEGEIKAMVAYQCLDSDQWQVMGIQGKNSFGNAMDKLAGKDVWILYDPDADEQAREDAKKIHARAIFLKEKIDDAILGGYVDTPGLRRLIRYARSCQ